MYPYDKAVVEAAKEAGFLVSYHNCGCGQGFIEDMADTGAHSLETLTPKTSSGDFDLAESKRRVGDRITLNGGFNERILSNGTPEEARDEAKRCIDAAGEGGRYVLRSTGQIMDSAPGNIQEFAEAGREHGRY
jgi:uroporphyrinogen decarboxylase